MKIFAFLASVSFAVDCKDGNNGGCSHSCKAGTCICPTCWVLTADNMTCLPEAGKATVSCSSTDMAITVDPCVVDLASSITLIDSSCAATSDSDGNYHLSAGLDECGAEYTVNSDDDTIVFSNKLLAGPGIRDRRIVSRPITMSFECTFSTFYEDVNFNQSVDAGLVSASFDFGDAQPDTAFFSYGLQFYTDDSYDTLLDVENAVIAVGNTIYVAVENMVPVSGLVFTVESCTVSDPSIGAEFKLIEDQCPNIIASMENFADAEQVRFSFTSFLFPNSDDDTELNFSCDVVICDGGDSDSICSTDPNCSSRKRRSNDDQIGYSVRTAKTLTFRK
ncbi:Oidioi.mRNA.OKI2018_I69.PAR.g8725.t1.cds [Oikopleura dioica]|uniref:Oidioi.mRNA.OKI2018_I69.PAR.g8725.t1.cds n=1 Tax=Oikopleura dioica TaxID=34765 RepID=A0ABN7RKP9_OIKDI|nr:Oidioi.mRNA.OKI2018_I69.PAR.g8725.t1.cds [Oikopleura dioica]